jgi:cell division septation protein DedD
MKEADLHEKAPVYFISKWVIILAIIITSSVSFALGFFVGKNVQPPPDYQQPLIPQQEESFQQDIPAEENVTIPSTPEQTQDNLEPSPRQSQQDMHLQETASTYKKTSKIIKYTVQAGAFKNSNDADSLKEKLAKKGYKTYVTLSETKNHEKIYKVRVGEFNTRKEAEVLSIRIKKSDGLNTFVTFK